MWINLGVGFAVAAVVVTALVLVSCTANEPHRTVYDANATGEEKEHVVIETAPEYKLGFVEFDDQGWFWDPRQLVAVKEMITSELRAHEGQGHGIVVIVFVHGWKHNAAYDDDNVEMFRGVLKQLNVSEQVDANLQGRPARPIVGVYGGWRGLSASFEPFVELSFWDRKNTAQQVGHGAMTQLLSGLEDLQLESNKRVPVGAPRTELIIVGHSFGGAAVYSALSQIVAERFMEATRLHRPAKSVGDLVILLNPAFEAARHYSLNELAINVEKYPPNQRPVLGIFTSEGDWATHYAFWIGRALSTLFDSDRSDKPQGEANRTAIGWFEPFVTHRLHYDVNQEAPQPRSTFVAKTGKHEPHDVQGLEASLKNTHALRQKWETELEKPMDLPFDDCILKPEPTYKLRDPFYVVAVDKKIMSGHNDISNPLMLNFLQDFILFCRPNARREADQ